MEVLLDRIDTTALLGRRCPIVGMVHLEALPGAPRWGGSMDGVLERAREDTVALVEGGVDGVLVENYGDVPFRADRVDAVTVAAMTRAVLAVASVTALPIGVNVLRNDALAALSIAAVTGASFVRVNVHTGGLLTDQGWIAGRADETLRERERHGVRVAILADVAVKHAVIPPGFDPAVAAVDAWERGLADALIVTGAATGSAPDADRVRRVRAALPDARIWLGSGVTAENAAALLTGADGVIVGSAVQHGGRAGAGVDADRVRRLVDAVRSLG
jgi:membrane complex biogenesis BtpA family protein